MAALNPEIIKAVAVTAELTGTQITELGMQAMVEHLSGYETQSVLKALYRCQLELRGGLSLGAVIDRLDDGHPGPEVAWAMVAGLSEEDSVVWTDDIARSFGLVRGMLHDRVGARMAFLEDYRRRLSEARLEKRAPAWWASLGYDPARRASPVLEAVGRGRLTTSRARLLLGPHEVEHEAIALDGATPAGLEAARSLVENLTRDMVKVARKDDDADKPKT